MGISIDEVLEVLFKDIVNFIEVVNGKNKNADKKTKEDVQTVQKEKNFVFDIKEDTKIILENVEKNTTKVNIEVLDM